MLPGNAEFGGTVVNQVALKTIEAYIKKLPAAQPGAIAEGTRQKVVAILLQQDREATGLTQV